MMTSRELYQQQALETENRVMTVTEMGSCSEKVSYPAWVVVSHGTSPQGTGYEWGTGSGYNDVHDSVLDCGTH